MYKHIAVAYDESDEANRALATAVSLARNFGATLEIVILTKPQPMYEAYAEAVGPDVAMILDQDHGLLYARLQAKAVTLSEAAGIATNYHFVAEAEIEGFLRLLRSQQADLLVLGLHHKRLIISRLWSTVFELAQEAPCSVLGVH